MIPFVPNVKSEQDMVMAEPVVVSELVSNVREDTRAEVSLR